MRLIDAYAMLKELGVSDRDIYCKCLIEEQPTVEARPVVHGEWLPHYEEVEIYNAGGFTERKQTGWHCGKCGLGFTTLKKNFCPNCGADMRKKVQDGRVDSSI